MAEATDTRPAPHRFGLIHSGPQGAPLQQERRGFVGREWLTRCIARLRDDPHRRQLLLVGVPGWGKSEFMAHLAQEWNCPLHFVRKDSISGVTGVDPRACLVSLGQQLYQKYGREIFEQGSPGSTRVITGWTRDQAVVVGRYIDELYMLPFLPPTERDVTVSASVTTGSAQVIGEHVRRLVDVTLPLEPQTLLHVAVLDPLRRLAERHPDERVVILIDALDESSSHMGMRIVDVLPRPSDAGFPINLRLVMTSRPGNLDLTHIPPSDVLDLDDRQAPHWKEQQQDIQLYLQRRFSEPPLAEVFARMTEASRDSFTRTVAERSDGNLLYLQHLTQELADHAGGGRLSLDEAAVPKGLDTMYQHFAVKKIRDSRLGVIWFTLPASASTQAVQGLLERLRSARGVRRILRDRDAFTLLVENTDKARDALYDAAFDAGVKLKSSTERVGDLGAWEEKYLPILGVLAISFEALTREQLARFARVEPKYVDRVVAALGQFLLVRSEATESRYRLYHSSFADYLLDPRRNRDYPLDGRTYHAQLVASYRREAASWSEVEWGLTDEYGLRHLAEHLGTLITLGAAGRRDGPAVDYRQELHGLLCLPFMEAKRLALGSHLPFLQDVELAIAVARAEKPPHLARELRGYLLSATLASMAHRIPLEALLALVQLGRARQAEELASLIQAPQRRMEARLAMGDALAERRETEAAREEFQRAAADAHALLEARLDATYVLPEPVVVQVLTRLAPSLYRVQALDELRKVLQPVGFYTGHLLAWLAEALAQAGEKACAVELALRALSLTEAQRGAVKVKPLASLLTRASMALALAGERERAVEVANQAVATAAQLDDPMDRAGTLAWAAAAFAGAGAYDAVGELLGKIEDPTPYREALGALARAFKEAGESERARSIARRTGNPSMEAALRDALADTRPAAGEGEASPASVAPSGGGTEALPTLTRRVQEIVSTEGVEQAAGFVDSVIIGSELFGGLPSAVWALSAAAQQLVRVGERARAAELAQETLAAAYWEPDPTRRARAMVAALQALSASGQLSDALVVYGALDQAPAEVVLRASASLAANAARAAPRMALSLVENFLSGALKFEVPEVRAEVLRQTAIALMKAGKPGSALRLVARVPLKFQRALCLCDVASAYAESGHRRGALMLARMALDTVVEQGMQDGQTLVVADEWDFRRPFTLFDEQSWKQAVALTEVARVFAAAGGLECARQAAAQAVQFAEKLQDEGTGAAAFCRLATAFVLAGAPEQARDMATRTLTLANKTHPTVADRAFALGHAASALARVGEPEQALGLLEDAFATARRAGRVAVLTLFQQMAEVLAEWDGGQTLEAICDEFLALETWWVPEPVPGRLTSQ